VTKGDNSKFLSWLDSDPEQARRKFNEILFKLDPDPEKAQKRLGEICERLKTLFDSRLNYLRLRDSKETRNREIENLKYETFRRVKSNLENSEKVEKVRSNIMGHIFGVAKHVWQEYRRELDGKGPIPQEFERLSSDAEKENIEDREIEKLYNEYVRKCVERLDPDDRELIIERFWKDRKRGGGKPANLEKKPELKRILNKISSKKSKKIKKILEEKLKPYIEKKYS
jgi:DNA-directed RNA polymerase specialized sigma24 family protein